MKRAVVIMAIIFTIMAVCSLGVIWAKTRKVDIAHAQTGYLTFVVGDVNVHERVSDKELSQIKELFIGKSLFRDNPSCGFTADISIEFDDTHTFCFANDGCPLVYWKENNQYFRLTKDEQAQLYGILEQYGFFFPCI